MPIATFSSGHAFGIGMLGQVTSEDASRVDLLARAARVRAGRPLVVFTLTAEESQAPDQKVRDSMRRSIDRMFDEQVFGVVSSSCGAPGSAAGSPGRSFKRCWCSAAIAID